MALRSSLARVWNSFSNALEKSKITTGIRTFDTWLCRLGTNLDVHMQKMEPRRKYLIELLLRVPLIFVIHQWSLLSPTSDYMVIELFLFVFRYIAAVFLFGTWALPTKTMLPMYLSIGTNLLIGWLLEIIYWMYQNEAEGICSTWLDDREVPWWTVSLSAMTLQILYILYLTQKYDSCRNYTSFEAGIIIATILPHLFCMSGIFSGISTPIFYYSTKILFTGIGFGIICYYFANSGMPVEKLTKEELDKLNPGKWFMRDLMVSFTLLYYGLCIMIDVVRFDLNEILTISYVTSFMGDWCTSLVIVMGLSAAFGFLSNLLVALSRFLITGQREFATAVFDINIGGRVNLAMTIFCLEAGLLSVVEETRIENCKSVLFLSFYVILAQAWDMTEQQCYLAVNGGESRSVFAYLRVLIFAFTITAVPTLLTFKVADFLQLDVWMLLNASGTVILLFRAVCTLIELVLGTLAWKLDNHLDKVEDAMYFIRLSKNAGTGIASLILGYYRMIAPFFSGWIVFRLLLVICEIVGVAQLILYREWIGFQNRRKFLKQLDIIPVATEEQLRELNDVCCICFAEINEGKVLQNCSHIFHKACLRKWFQLRITCPLCNKVAF